MQNIFSELENSKTSMQEFRLKWRFTEAKHRLLPNNHLGQIMPLNSKGSEFLWNYVISIGLHDELPFPKDYFKKIVHYSLIEDCYSKEAGIKRVKKWLYNRKLPFQKTVYLSYQPDIALITNWKILVKYWDSFYYPSSDDLTVIDESNNWALLFFHEDEIFFGSKF